MLGLARKLKILACLHHLRILGETTRLHEVRILILLQRQVLCGLKLTHLAKLRCSVMISREPFVVGHAYVRILIETFGLSGGAKLANAELII